MFGEVPFVDRFDDISQCRLNDAVSYRGNPQKSRFPAARFRDHGAANGSGLVRPAFAPRELPRFSARMRVLTSAAPSSPPNALTGLRLSVPTLSGLPTIPSPTTVSPFPCRQSHTTPTATGFPRAAPRQTDQVGSDRHDSEVWISPFPSRLTGGLGRNGFVLLRTGRSPPVASHLERSSHPCRAADAVTFRFRPERDSPEEDFRLSDQTISHTHWDGQETVPQRDTG